jgi:pimeloyl-ACP methyl ester carboxylesterase
VRHPEALYLAGCDRVRAHGTAVTIVRATDGFVPAGDGDEPLGAPFGERARRLNATLVVVAGGHHLHVERPDVVADAIVG